MTVRSARLILPAAAAVAACAIAGCSSSKAKSGGSSAATPPPSTSAAAPSSTPASTSASAGTSDYKSLLIKASDIPVAGFTLVTSQAPPAGKGITGIFVTADGTRQVGDTIIVLPNADAAKTALTAAEGAAKDAIEGATVKSLDVGDGGQVFTGTTGSGAKASVELLFTEGNALVSIEFDGQKGDTVPDAVLAQVANAQDAAIKANPPS